MYVTFKYKSSRYSFSTYNIFNKYLLKSGRSFSFTNQISYPGKYPVPAITSIAKQISPANPTIKE
jgi:hypothetical protein